jgi:hypothetical protein
MVTIRYDHVLSTGGANAPNSTSYSFTPTFILNQTMFYYDSSKYVSPTIYLEVITKSVTATSNDTYVKLLESTSDSVESGSWSDVSSSELISSTTTFTNYRSSALTLTSGKRYAFQCRNEASASATSAVTDVRIVILDDVGPTPNVATPIEPLFIGWQSSSSASYAEMSQAEQFYYDSSVYTGTINVYFEAVVQIANAATSAYCELYDIAAGAVVSGSELSTTSTTRTRLRTASAITLTSGHNYAVYFKTGNASYAATVCGAKLIIEQTGAGTITKTRLKAILAGQRSGAVTSYAASNVGGVKYRTADWTSSSPTIKAQVTLHGSTATTCYGAILTINSTTVLSNGELTTSNTSKTILTGGSAVSPANNTTYQTGWKKTTSGTVYDTNDSFIFDLTFPSTTTTTKTSDAKLYALGVTTTKTSDARLKKTIDVGRLDDQETGSTTTRVGSSYYLRVAQKKTISGTVASIGFKLAVNGSPLGLLYLRIRKVSDDSIISDVASFGSGDLTGTQTWYDLPLGTPVAINEAVYLSVESNGGDASNYFSTTYSNSDVKASENESYYTAGAWNDNATYDLCYHLLYSPGYPSDAKLVSAGATTYTFTSNSNARLKRLDNNQTKTSDARLSKNWTTTKLSDARLKKTWTITKTSDARLKKEWTITKTSDARLKRIDNTQTKTSDARLSKNWTITKTSDAKLYILGKTITKTSDARLSKNWATTKLSDARLKRLDNNQTKLSDARLVKTWTTTKTSDSRLKKEWTITKTSDAQLKVLGKTLTKTSDAKLAMGGLITKTSDARLKRLDNTFTKLSDTRLVRLGTLTKTADARLKLNPTITKTSDARLSLTTTYTKLSNARLKLNPSITKPSDSRLKKEWTITKTSDAKLYVLGKTFTKTSDARLSVGGGVSKTADARLKRLDNTFTKTSDARIVKNWTITKTADARLKKEWTFTKLSDGRLRLTVTSTKTSDARLKKEVTITKNSNARLIYTKDVTIYSNARLKQTFTRTISSDARLFTPSKAKVQVIIIGC